jgi:acyl-CoA thioesterase
VTTDDRTGLPATNPADRAVTDAQRHADAMWAEDQASQRLGMALHDVGPGRAELSMTVRDDMVNGHGICHGGFLAALADSAFAFACNTYGPVTVAAGFDITFVASARIGDRLVARATERVRYGRSGIYDVTVLRCGVDADTVIAEFRGRSRSLPAPDVRTSASVPANQQT